MDAPGDFIQMRRRLGFRVYTDEKATRVYTDERIFLEFLKRFKTDPNSPEPHYESEIERMMCSQSTTMYIDFSHVMSFNDVLWKAISEEYLRFEPYLRKACNRFIMSHQSGENRPIFADDNPNKEVNIGFYNIQLLKKLRELTTVEIGKLTAVMGVVTRTSKVRPEVLEGTFRCLDCGGLVKNVEQQFKYTKKSNGETITNLYNVEAADILANEAQILPISDSAPIYEKLLSTFPTAAKFWKQYVEAYMAVNNEAAVKQIFGRCLLNCLNINLWRSYIRFIRKVNEMKGPEGLNETKKAFDFMLSYVGSDIASGQVWLEYIAFLKSMPAMSAQEESQRMISVRKIYQQAILIPTNNLDQLWRDYEIFENSVSRTLAKGLLSDYQPKFNSAKAVYRERKKYVDDIDWCMLAIPPTGSSKEEGQCMAWKKLLAFEKGNPQRIDATTANRRVNFTYEQCLMYLYHYPDVWYDYAMWHAKNGSIDSAIKIFQRALKALPESELLKYAYAELEESRGAIQPAKKIYESLVSDENLANSLSHIQFIRFLRRTEGVESARKYFLEVRKSSSCTYQVFVAYAMMVFCIDKDSKVAQSVFEAGMKKFMHEPSYILEYVDFLCRLNDDRNVRALFERVLSSLPSDESLEVWNRFVQFEQTYGDLSTILKVEQRRKEALVKSEEDNISSGLESNLYDIVTRYSYKDLWPCSSKDLDHLSRQQWLSKNSSKKLENIQGGGGGQNIFASSSSNLVLPDVSRMVIYNPRQTKDFSAIPSQNVSTSGNVNTKEIDDILKMVSPSLAAFITNLPPVEGPLPDVDIVMSILLQSNVPAGKPASSNPNQNGSRNPGKRKDFERQEEEEGSLGQIRPLPRDVFRLRQIQRTRGGIGIGGVIMSSNSQSGSVISGGSGVSGGEQSGYSGSSN